MQISKVSPSIRLSRAPPGRAEITKQHNSIEIPALLLIRKARGFHFGNFYLFELYVIFSTVSVYPPIAQSVEQLPFKQMVVGSIPTGRTNFTAANRRRKRRRRRREGRRL
jgi:hypothetical protein